ncbi:hypothetical protein PMSV_1681 [Photobacterium leiognathi subsp. mandapamensis svers.1.1.]|nr:hypothetical protein PMSV_1681 [Photobacterium leiognathi subsp. mandapamensis svers.1.1.]
MFSAISPITYANTPKKITYIKYLYKLTLDLNVNLELIKNENVTAMENAITLDNP